MITTQLSNQHFEPILFSTVLSSPLNLVHRICPYLDLTAGKILVWHFRCKNLIFIFFNYDYQVRVPLLVNT